jgi:regulator of replication initiation timing
MMDRNIKELLEMAKGALELQKEIARLAGENKILKEENSHLRLIIARFQSAHADSKEVKDAV